MPVKKVTSKKVVSKKENDKKITPRATALSVPVYSLAGRASGTMSLPKEVFGREVNKNLLAQAVRVYMTNQSMHPGSTKTRGEVRGSTAKIWRQKGTGRARHGARTAPIFVGGGITFGPKPRKVRLDLPKKMKKAALLSALSAKMVDKGVLGVSGLDKTTGKTKEIVGLMSTVYSLGSTEKKQKNVSALIVTGSKQDNVVRAVRNIPGVDVMPAILINAYEVLRHQLLLVTKESIDVILGSTSTSLSMTPESKKADSGHGSTSLTTSARMTSKKRAI